jgi:hypothetical protein
MRLLRLNLGRRLILAPCHGSSLTLALILHGGQCVAA